MSWRTLLGAGSTNGDWHDLPQGGVDTALSGPVAAWAVTAMLYIDAVVPASGDFPADTTWARPSTVMWLSEDAYARTDAASREAWREAALAGNGRKRLEQLMSHWGMTFEPRYADNSREGVRDETWPAWADEGAVRIRPGVKTTSSAPRWALTDAFADLFDPALMATRCSTRSRPFATST